MMETVKVTKEVGMALKDLFARGDKDYSHDEILNLHTRSLKGDGWAGEKWKYLNHLSMLEMATALLIGYEVEEEYKVGDWVITGRGMMGNFLEVNKGVFIFTTRGGVGKSDNLRHATPEEIKAEQERRVWKSIGREVKEVREGDCLQVGGTYYKVFKNMGCDIYGRHISIEQANAFYEIGSVTGFYPSESFISFGGESHDN